MNDENRLKNALHQAAPLKISSEADKSKYEKNQVKMNSKTSEFSNVTANRERAGR